MPRPRISIEVRYRDVISMWQSAIGCPQTRDRAVLWVQTPSPNHAVALRHKLNAGRAAVRGDKGYIPWDDYVVRLNGNIVEIWLKELFDWSAVMQGDGTPLPDDVRAGAEYRQLHHVIAPAGDSGRPQTDEEIEEQLAMLRANPPDAKKRPPPPEAPFDPAKLMDDE